MLSACLQACKSEDVLSGSWWACEAFVAWDYAWPIVEGGAGKAAAAAGPCLSFLAGRRFVSEQCSCAASLSME